MATFIVGLTGGIGSGKTTVSNQLAEYGIDIVDADIVAREVVAFGSEGLTKITEHFGTNVLNPDGSLDRSALRNIIFSNEQEKLWLNNLLHPLIRQEITRQLNAADSPYVVLSAPLLFENGLQKYTHHNLLIDIAEQEQIARSMKRDNVQEQQIRAIIASQMSRSEKLALANDVIDNTNLSFEALRERVKNIHLKYLSLANRLN